MEKSGTRTGRLNPALTEVWQGRSIMQTHSAPAPIPVAPIPAFSPDQWLFQLFSPLAVAEGCALRCDVAEVEAKIGRTRFLAEVKIRGYRAKESAGQFLLTFRREPLRIMV